MNFKTGDRVKYTVRGPLDWETKDWAGVAGLVLGNTYTISCVGVNHVQIEQTQGISLYNLSPLHFELAETEQTRTTTRYDILCGRTPMSNATLKSGLRKRFVCYFHFVGWENISFGAHVNVIQPNMEIHLPFGFIRIGWDGVPGRRFGFTSYRDYRDYEDRTITKKRVLRNIDGR
jgi:hypothetical protein